MEPVLRAVGISKRFGGVTALDRGRHRPRPRGGACPRRGERCRQVDADQDPHRRLRRDEGEITYRGEAVSLSSPRDAWDMGISTTFQEITLVPLMSVARNLYLGNEPRGALEAARCQGDEPQRRGTAASPRHRHRRSPPGELVRRRCAADDRHRARRVDRRPGGDPRRADVVARAARGGPGVRHDPPIAESRGRPALRQPQPRRGVRDLRPHHDPA